ncbi:MAG: TSUP family transporter [Acidimicrobiia bacterium]|nr:TSUP family transporter [Acidimicrobiia bacterium]
MAAPLGILLAAAGSLAAAPRQLAEGIVHHRLGVVLEIAASAGAIGGALLGAAIDPTLLGRVLGVVALLVALTGLRRTDLRNPPHPPFAEESPGEWPGTLAGAYRLDRDEVVPYQARRVPLGLGAMLAAGLVAGLGGVGGGFIKTPAMREIMWIPVKVAAATTTFTVGVTAATSVAVFAGQGRIDYRAGAAVVLGGIVGGLVGARVQDHLPPAVGPRRAQRGAGDRRGRAVGDDVNGRPDPRRARQRLLLHFLRATVALVAVLAATAVVLPAPTGRTVAVGMVLLLVTVPVVRIAWLGLRWFRRGDARFAVAAAALLAVVATAAVAG